MTTTTVKIDNGRAVVVNHAAGGAVRVDLKTFGITAISVELTPDQAAILGEALSLEAVRSEVTKARECSGQCYHPGGCNCAAAA